MIDTAKRWITGMTSVTFRGKSRREIAELVKEAGLDGIEWGGDVHVAPGGMQIARETGNMTRELGLKVLSYGSYYRLCKGEDITPILETAKELGAPRVRIWAGEKTPDQAEEAYWEAAVEEARKIARKAEKMGLSISTEYHRGTLTQTAEGALRLMQEVGQANFQTYWQPNPDITHEKNLAELRAIREYVTNIHVFRWKGKDVRYSLEDGRAEWLCYLAEGPVHEGDACIMEFVKDDSPEQFLEDAKTLFSMLKE